MFVIEAIGHYLYNYVFGLGGIGAVVSVAAWLLWYFTPALLAGSKTTILHVAIVATALTVANTYLSSHYFKLGYQTAINEVAANTKETKDAISKAGQSIDDCNSRGGTWDTTSGVCSK